MPSSSSFLHFGSFCNVSLRESRCIFVFSPSLSSFKFFLCRSSFRLLCYVPLATLFCSKIVLFPCHLVVGSSSGILPLIFFIVLECPVFSLLFFLSRYLLNLPSFTSTFLFISSGCIVCFTCLSFSLFVTCSSVFLWLITVPNCRRFLTCISSRISYPGLKFLFVFFQETLIL